MPPKKQPGSGSSKTKAVGRSEKQSPKEIVDSTLDEVGWYRRFVNDFCCGDEAHPLVQVCDAEINEAQNSHFFI